MKTLKIFLLSIVLLLSISTGVKAEFFSDVIVTSPHGIWTDSRAYGSLTAAVNAVGTVLQRTIVISSQLYVGNITISPNITLKFERDGAIIHTGQLTLNTTNIIAENRQIFAGGGDVDFAPGTVVKSGWFSTFESAVDLTSDDTVTLVVTKPQTLTTSYALGNNVTLKWESPGNILTADAGVNITNISQVEAGNYQILSGAGHFHFQDGSVLNLTWFPHLRTALTWVSATNVTLVVYGSNPVDFSDSIPSNISVRIEKGGDLAISNGIILTIASAKQIDIGSYYLNPFTGTGSVVITGGSTYTPATDLTGLVLSKLTLPIVDDLGNIFIGSGSFLNNTTGTDNQAIGVNSLAKNTTGSSNQAIGMNSLAIRKTVIYAVAIGENAMRYATESATYGPQVYRGGGGWSVAVGKDAARGDPGTNYCAEGFVAIGESALMHQTTGTGNTAVGSLAALYNTTGNGIIAIGSQALQDNTIGNDNTSVGAGALLQNTIGSRNTAVGRQTMSGPTIGTATTASDNTAVGSLASRDNISGANNTAVGSNSLVFNTASNNTAVGYSAGQNDNVSIAANSSMTYVGKDAISVRSNLTNSLAVGAGAQVVESNAAQIGNRVVDTFNFGAQKISWKNGVPFYLATTLASVATAGDDHAHVVSALGMVDGCLIGIVNNSAVTEWFFASVSGTTISLFSDAGLGTKATLLVTATGGNVVTSHSGQSWRRGDIVYNKTATVGQPIGWVCTLSGTFPASAGTAGTATTGSPIITGMASTTGYEIGSYITASARWADNNGLWIIARTATTLTVDRNANANGAMVATVVVPTFTAMANL